MTYICSICCLAILELQPFLFALTMYVITQNKLKITIVHDCQ